MSRTREANPSDTYLPAPSGVQKASNANPAEWLFPVATGRHLRDRSDCKMISGSPIHHLLTFVPGMTAGTELPDLMPAGRPVINIMQIERLQLCYSSIHVASCSTGSSETTK
jgi:hypothetical protein